MHVRAQLTVLGALATLALGPAQGCKSPCDDFNAYRGYDQTDPEDPNYKNSVKPEEGNFRVIVYRVGDEKVIDTALKNALSDSGGGSAEVMGDKDKTQVLRDFARSSAGPYPNKAVQIGRYEVTFRADNLDMLQAMKVVWKGDTAGGPLTLPVNEGDQPLVTLLELGGGEYKLVFSADAKLFCDGPRLAFQDSGYAIKGKPFDLQVADQAANIEVGQQKVDVLEPPLLMYEVTNFSGDLSKFLCQLCREKRHNEDGTSASFVMKQTYVWVDGSSQETTGGLTVDLSVIHKSADARPEDVKVKIGSLSFDAPGKDVENDAGTYTLEVDFNRETRDATITFKLAPKRALPDDWAQFEYKINGTPYTERRKIGAPGDGQ
jgi:hypothetical protein